MSVTEVIKPIFFPAAWSISAMDGIFWPSAVCPSMPVSVRTPVAIAVPAEAESGAEGKVAGAPAKVAEPLMGCGELRFELGHRHETRVGTGGNRVTLGGLGDLGGGGARLAHDQLVVVVQLADDAAGVAERAHGVLGKVFDVTDGDGFGIGAAEGDGTGELDAEDLVEGENGHGGFGGWFLA